VQISQSNVSSDSATLQVSASVRNRDVRNQPYTLRTSIVDASGNVVAQQSNNFNSRRGKLNRVGQTVTVDNPRLWNGTADPYLYTAYIQIIMNGQVFDTLPQTIGIRKIEMDATGFKLNGNYLELKGVNIHDDKTGVGTAMTDADRDRDFKLMKEMGANSVRTAHWQFDKDFYDEADRHGFIVWTEVALWRRITASQEFTDNSVLAMREMIRQNFNHPSIAFWGIFNELPNNSDTINVLNAVNSAAKSEDPGRFTIAATELDFAQINDIPDVLTYNKYFGWYGNYSADADSRLAEFTSWLANRASAHPTTAFGMGEYGAGANINHHVNDPRDGAPPSDPNATQFHPEEYQAYFHEKHWEAIEAAPKSPFGNFIWQFTDSGNDNRNEGSQPGINDKGLVTYDRRFAKDAFYYYKSQWSNEPVLYLNSKRYTQRDEPTTTVRVYSNLGTNVELLVNGSSRGTRNDADGVLEWSGVTLNNGNNTILVRSTKSGKTYTDTITWNYTPDLEGAGLSGGFGSGGFGSGGFASAVVATPADAEPNRVTDDVLGTDETIV
jgi:beta-galactosidase